LSDTIGTLTRYAAFMQALRPADLDRLDEMFTPDVRFSDPFSDVSGHAGLRAVFGAMFADMEAPRFEVLDIAPTPRGGYLKWRFTGQLRGGALDFVGTSEVEVRDGLIARHTDYWDAARGVYETLPVLGGLLRLLRRRIGHADRE